VCVVNGTGFSCTKGEGDRLSEGEDYLHGLRDNCRLYDHVGRHGDAVLENVVPVLMVAYTHD